MNIMFQCGNCSQAYSVDPSHAGKLVTCQSCKVQLRIPGAVAGSNPQINEGQSAKRPPVVQQQANQQPMNSGNPAPANNATVDVSAGNQSLPQALEEYLIARLTYEKTGTIADIQNDMERLRFFDKHHEDKQKKHSYQMLLFIAILVVFGVLGVVLIINSMILFGVLCLIAATVGLVFMIYNITKYQKHARLNLDDKRYECMNEFLRLVAVDSPNDAPFSAKLVFGKHDRKEAHAKSGKVGYWDVEFFVNEWFSVAGKLKDGSKFSVDIKEKQQNRSRWKRSASGKMKHKSKQKNSEEISLIIRPKVKRYPDLQKLVPDATQALQLPDYAELKSFTFQQEAIVLKVAVRGRCVWRDQAGVNHQVRERVNLLAMMLLSIYQVLNLCKELQKSSA